MELESRSHAELGWKNEGENRERKVAGGVGGFWSVGCREAGGNIFSVGPENYDVD
jgi:hypothetical protein